MYAWFDNTADEAMTPGARPINRCFSSILVTLNSAITVSGGYTTTAYWTGNDDWYGVIVAIKTAASKPHN